MARLDRPLALLIRSLGDAFFPPLIREAEEARARGDEVLADYYEFSGGQPKDFPEKVMFVLKERLPSKEGWILSMVLRMLTYRLGTLLLGGWHAVSLQYPFVRTFAELPIGVRQNILKSWCFSSFVDFRRAFRAFKNVFLGVLLTDMDEHNKNPVWPALQYDGPLTGDKRPKPVPAKLQSEKVLLSALTDFWTSPPQEVQDLRHTLQANGYTLANERAGNGADVTLECDAVVVGSGAGGGPVAALLAAAGLRVIVVERYGYNPVDKLGLSESPLLRTAMIDRAGFAATDSAGVFIFAGATVGGGTRINWSASFRTPDHVRREWSQTCGLPVFETERYEHAMDAVCKQMHVNTDGKMHSGSNSVLKVGLERLGVHCGLIPRNCDGEHACGYCSMGCPSGEKQDSSHAWLPAAAKDGALILAGVYVKEVIMEKLRGSEKHNGRKMIAKGVLCEVLTAQGKTTKPIRIAINAPIVVSCAGSLHSPALLLRSGIRVNGNVGSNLRLHPVTAALAYFPTQAHPKTGIKGPIKLWEGGIMTVYSKEVANWDTTGYGSLLECPAVHMGVAASVTSWTDGVSFKHNLLDIPHVASVIVINRDQGSGSVYLDSTGSPSMRYSLSEADKKTMMEGLLLGLRVLVEAGATKLTTLQLKCGIPFLIQRDAEGEVVNKAELEAYLDQVQAEGFVENKATLYSAHQMGTCAMGSSPAKSVIDSEGECWEVANLFVADGSCLPTPSGVNPMITITSIAYMIGEGIASKYGKKLQNGSARMHRCSAPEQ